MNDGLERQMILGMYENRFDSLFTAGKGFSELMNFGYRGGVETPQAATTLKVSMS